MWKEDSHDQAEHALHGAVMTGPGTATASIEVGCDPATAFTIFTAEIGTWWRRGTMYWNDAERGLELRFEPFVGGRLLEVYEATSGEAFELGRVTAWEPGTTLGFTWRTAEWPDGVSTDVLVRFVPRPDGCLVTIEHSGWDRLGAAGAAMSSGYGRGWGELLGYYSAYLVGV
jgi:uncharacterized protein YndB with AHSA1/START domain